ncbi:MAG: Cupin 2 conserved barrel domain protein [Rhodospirillales bacterium]|nr:Cupin 2 conserved barrel domain protein [Rhodospirillales bacterium]
MKTTMHVRCVVTGHHDDGRSTCVEDRSVVEGPGWMHDLWTVPSLPADNAQVVPPPSPKLLLAPPRAGGIFRFFKIPPDSVREALDEASIERTLHEIGAETASSADRSRNQLWHRTATIDFVVLLQGEAVLHLDDGDVVLKPYDCVVQRGTRHAWSNPGDTEAVCMCVLLDADPLVTPTVQEKA